MNAETKVCRFCKSQFTIEPDDFSFYEKIEVPLPTFCPECRNQRRMSWRNERSLYKRKCDAPGHAEDIITMFDPAEGHVVYDAKYWWSDEWDPIEYGLEYDSSQPFFVQFQNLVRKVPLVALSNINSPGCEYANYIADDKNCYLIFGTGWSENVRYGNKLLSCKDSQDLLMCSKLELSYECVGCVESHRLFYSKNSKSCTDSYFLYNCRNCTNCVGCANLMNKSHCIFNIQYSKEEYAAKFKDLNLQSRAGLQGVRAKFLKDIYLEAIHRYANVFSSVNCTGDNINHAKNLKHCFDVYENVEDSKYLYSAVELRDSYDGNGVWKNELSYEYVDSNIGTRGFSTITVYDSQNMQYSWNCHNSKNCFGCYGLRNKEYCILNKQYSKEEYERLRAKIIEDMSRNPYISAGIEYKYGEFFPSVLSPFAYNETIAHEYFPLSKPEATSKGLRFKEHDVRNYKITLQSEAIPDRASEVSDSILHEVIACAHRGKCLGQCTTAFKVIQPELQFYRQLNIPLPALCPNCRHEERLKQKNPLKLWHRRCMCNGANSKGQMAHRNTSTHFHGAGECPNEFETSYSPERPEIIYCEQCYQQEVI
jgi:Zn ribbon nucleic-acid-binding protein